VSLKNPFVVSLIKAIPKNVEFRSSEQNPDMSGSNHNGDKHKQLLQGVSMKHSWIDDY